MYSYILGPALRVLGGAGYGCRFYPSCSEYARDSVIQHGWLRGGLKSVRRLIRCNPWTSSSWWDPVTLNSVITKRPDISGDKQT